MRVKGLEFMVHGSWFWVWGLGLRKCHTRGGLEVKEPPEDLSPGFGFAFLVSGFWVLTSCVWILVCIFLLFVLRVSDSCFPFCAFGFRFAGLKFCDSGFRLMFYVSRFVFHIPSGFEWWRRIAAGGHRSGWFAERWPSADSSAIT